MHYLEQANHSKRGMAMIELIFAIVIIGVTLMSAPMLINQSIDSSNIAMQQEAITATASHNGVILTKYWDEASTQTQDGLSPMLVTGTTTDEEMENNSSQPVDSNGIPFGSVFPNGKFFPNFPFKFVTFSTDNPFGFIIDGSNIYRAGLKNVTGRICSLDGNPIKATPKIDLKNEESTVGEYDDVDDYSDGKGYGVAEESASDTTTTQKGDYLDKEVSVATKVSYINDIPTTFAQTSVAPNLLKTTQATTPSNIKLVETRLGTASSEKELSKNIVLYSFSANIGSSIPQGRRVE